MAKRVAKKKPDAREPRVHGRYTLTHGMGVPSVNPTRLEVWSYEIGAMDTRREFHLDVYDGDRYIGHLTFRATLP